MKSTWKVGALEVFVPVFFGTFKSDIIKPQTLVVVFVTVVFGDLHPTRALGCCRAAFLPLAC
jgi:hypothetical protein